MIQILVDGVERLEIALKIFARPEAVTLFAELIIGEQGDQPRHVLGNRVPQFDLGALHYDGGKQSHARSLPLARLDPRVWR